MNIQVHADGDRLRVSAPKGKLTDALRAQLAERKAELLMLVRRTGAAARLVPPPIRPRHKNRPIPASFAQERLWFLEQLEPGGSVYNICRAARLRGPLNIEALESSLNEILQRHEILRTAFTVIECGLVQVRASVERLVISLIDIRRLHEFERENEAARLIGQMAKRPFDLTTGPFLRAQLLRLRDDEHIFVLATHHIASDAWSIAILTRELWTLYEAFANGQASPLPNLPVQYADYAMWQRDWLQGEALEAQLSYWKERLGGDLPVLNISADRPRPTRQTHRGVREPISLPESLTQGLNGLSEQAGVTLYMTLLAAFNVLLHRYAGQDDIVVGSPIANRQGTEIEGLIGFFVNTLPFRTDLSGNPSFRELLVRVRDVCLGAYAHQDLPFEKLVEELQLERDLSRNPLFQAMFILQNAPVYIPKLSKLSWSRVQVEPGTAKFDLTLALVEREGRLAGFFEYNTDLFDASPIKAMIGHFQMLLRGVVANPDQPISTLPLLTNIERHQLLVDWNSTVADYPKESCIHELFEAQVERTPNAIAIDFEGKQLSYRELNARANQLAHYLHGLNVGPEKLVGICVERSLEMVIGLLGTLKAGGAYVPLDPVYPLERLAFILEDARVSVVVTQEKLLNGAQLSALATERSIVRLDRDRAAIAVKCEDNLPRRARAGNLAYVIYTSGSTGEPKGVQIEHRSVVNCLCSIGERFDVSERDSWLAVTTIAFDIASLELLLPLITGAKIVLTKSSEAVDGALLRKRLAISGATVMQATPPTWALLLDAGWQGTNNFKMLCGGEALSRKLADQLLEHSASLWNLYGPTETTIWSAIAQIQPGQGPVPIGRPIPNTQVYILDAHLQPVPIGVPGEIYIGGDGVARGYLERPKVSNDKFIATPFSGDPKARLFRTGDLARYLPDGLIEFLGRTDNQVKIRGHRVELGEMEAVLNQDPGVKESVIVAREDITEGRDETENPKSRIQNLISSKCLVAYVVPKEENPSMAELRNFLKAKLPDYMVPSIFVILGALPVTPNGKLNRNALPPPDGSRPGIEGFVAPRTRIEKSVAQAWRDVMKLESISVHDNFFELGGHSFLAIQIISRLRDAFNREIPVRLLFETPTVAALSVNIQSLIRDGSTPELPHIVPVTRDRSLPLSMNQEHLWFLDQMFPGFHFFNMPYVYRLSGALDIDALQKAIQELFRRHEALRTVFGRADDGLAQIIKEYSAFQLSVVDLRSEDPDAVSEKAADIMLTERTQPFDLALGPLLRIKLLRLTDAEYLLPVTMHHIIGDEWSMRLFRNELSALYEAYSQGRASPLPVLPNQFADYACWERQLLRDDLFDTQLNYWKKQLTGGMLELKFKKARKRTQRITFRTRRLPLEFEGTLFSDIKKLAHVENDTPFIIVLSALNILLQRWTGQRDIRIGTLVANRARKESEQVIGHFANTVILRNRVGPKMTYHQVIRQVGKVFREAVANQELPFEHLARVLERERKIRRTSLFRVMCMYHKPSLEVVNLHGITFAPLGWLGFDSNAGLTLTACDLVVNMREMESKITGSVNYKTDTFGNDVVAAMVNQLTRILKRMVADTRNAATSNS